MKPISDDEIEAFTSGRQKNLTLTFSDGTVIGNDDISAESMSFEQSICEDQQLTFGRCSSACFKVQLLGVAQRYAGLTVQAKISATSLTGVTYTRNIGTFKVVSDTATSNMQNRDLECYDALHDILSLDYSEWYNKLALPMTMKKYRDEFFKHIAIEQVSVELVNDGMTIERSFVANNYSGSDIIEDICEINGVLGILNSDNKFQYITVQGPANKLYPREDLYPNEDIYPVDPTGYLARALTMDEYYMGGLIYEEFTCQRITQLQVRMSENDIGAIVGPAGNTYVIQDNPLVYGKDSTTLTDICTKILSNIQYVTYTPVSLRMPAKLWFELGDSLTIHTGNLIISTIILTNSISGITALTQEIKSQGREYYEEQANSVQRSLLVTKQKTNELTRTLEETNSTITQLEEDVNGHVENLQSQITQNAHEISLRVSKGTVSSELSLEDDEVRLTTNRLIIDSSCFKLNSDGTIEIDTKYFQLDKNGSVKASDLTLVNNSGANKIIDTNKFEVSSNGVITATSVDISGTISTNDRTGNYLTLSSGTIQGYDKSDSSTKTLGKLQFTTSGTYLGSSSYNTYLYGSDLYINSSKAMSSGYIVTSLSGTTTFLTSASLTGTKTFLTEAGYSTRRSFVTRVSANSDFYHVVSALPSGAADTYIYDRLPTSGKAVTKVYSDTSYDTEYFLRDAGDMYAYFSNTFSTSDYFLIYSIDEDTELAITAMSTSSGTVGISTNSGTVSTNRNSVLKGFVMSY